MKTVRQAWRFATIYTSAPGQSLQLYKTWLLLLEVLDFSQFTDATKPFQPNLDHEMKSSTVATRHWYKTACIAAQVDRSVQGEGRVVQTTVPVRLPGHFSVRGDWFLAVAKGSRSSRLADRALDMLSSRRANRTRLHLGMGLPTRDLLEGAGTEELRTRLTITTPDATYNVKYGHLISLGGKYADENGEKRPWDDKSFIWLFRSGFHDYDRHAAAIHKWIHRLLTWTVQYRYQNRANWWERSGFDAYDKLEKGDLTHTITFRSFLHFARSVDGFVDDLNSASLKEDMPERFGEKAAEASGPDDAPAPV